MLSEAPMWVHFYRWLVALQQHPFASHDHSQHLPGLYSLVWPALYSLVNFEESAMDG